MAAQFDFLKTHDETLYKHLSDAEKSARLRLNNCANDLRCGLERLADILIQENIPKPSVLEHLYRDQHSKSGWDLNAKLKALQDEELLKKRTARKKKSFPLSSGMSPSSSRMGNIKVFLHTLRFENLAMWALIRRMRQRIMMSRS